MRKDVLQTEIMSEKELEAVREYYRNNNVRARIKEFCGGDPFTCEYIVGFGHYLARNGYRRPLRLSDNPADLEGMMEEGLDLFRAVWDIESTLAVWDVEYFNLDTWQGLYRDQLEYFELMEPSYRAITGLMEKYSIPHLNDSTSSGYHFISRVPFSSPVHRRLEEIGHLGASLRKKYRVTRGDDDKRKRPLPERDGLGYSGIGRLMEYLSHRVIEEIGESSPIPIAISDAAVGRMARGREGMSMDITQYADPLFMRDIRTTFSTHQKHKVYLGRVGKDLARRMPVYATVPRNNLSFRELFPIRSNLYLAGEYAANCCGLIPDGADGWGRVIDDYRKSSLFHFHREFDAVEHRPRDEWAETYWKLDLKSLPPCAAHAVRNANWGLLNPTSLQTLCRVLYARGWHPKHIAGLIRSYYEAKNGWNIDWQKYDPETRADFWCRIYCGLIATGNDTLRDFNCRDQQAKGFCPAHWCGFKLEDFRSEIEKR